MPNIGNSFGAHLCDQLGGAPLHGGDGAAVDGEERGIQLLWGIGKGCAQRCYAVRRIQAARLIKEWPWKQNGMMIIVQSLAEGAGVASLL